MSLFIPAGPGELTPDWVTIAMRTAGALPSGRVSAIDVRSLSDGGTGFTGDTVRVHVEYVGAPDGPPTIIAKFPTADRQNRGMLEQFDAYAREIRFYRGFADRMPCSVPAYLGADFDEDGARGLGRGMSRLVDALPDRVQLAITRDVSKFMRATTRRYALLIEDLGGDTTVHDMATPPSEEQVGDALEVLARVHGAFWGDPAPADEEVFRPILTTTPGLYQTVGRKRCLALARRRWVDWMTDDHVEILHEAIDRFPDDVAAINEKVTLIHGDPRSDNILYRDDAEVVLLDWALVGHAHPGFDVGYLLSSSIEPHRLGEIEPLLGRYEAELERSGGELDGRRLREVVEATYRALAVQQLMSIPVLNGEDYGNDAIYDIWMRRILAGLGHDW